MANIDRGYASFPTYEEMGEKIAEEALDGYIYNGKTLREWIDMLAQTQNFTKNDRDILVIKAKTVMKRSQMKDMYCNLLEQKQYGIILLDDTVDVMVVKDVIFSIKEEGK